jgi:hypothetical protein
MSLQGDTQIGERGYSLGGWRPERIREETCPARWRRNSGPTQPVLRIVVYWGRRHPMTKFILWLILLVFCWPLALLALVLYPFVWLLSIPFRLVGITVDAVFDLFRVLIMLPSRILGGTQRPRA